MFPCITVDYLIAVLHRDACYGNLMMDARRLIPKGFHFSSQSAHDSPFYLDKFKYTHRSAVASVDYFFIDFGLSKRFSRYGKRHLVIGKGGQNKTVPELSYEIPYDPFKVNIYQMGGVSGINRGMVLRSYNIPILT